MSDARIEAASEWVGNVAKGPVLMTMGDGGWEYGDVIDAHLAGQKEGEQREHEAFLRFLRSQPSGKLVCFAFLAAQIERGEHRK